MIGVGNTRQSELVPTSDYFSELWCYFDSALHPKVFHICRVTHPQESLTYRGKVVEKYNLEGFFVTDLLYLASCQFAGLDSEISDVYIGIKNSEIDSASKNPSILRKKAKVICNLSEANVPIA